MIQDIITASGKKYNISKLLREKKQYMDRDYRFDYIPELLQGCLHVQTHGNDKMISETDECCRFTCSANVDVYLLYPDKQPALPVWMHDFERTRMNVTRIDSDPSNLKGYFGVYKKSFGKGETIVLGGSSPQAMLDQEWYVRTEGVNYCMHTFCVREA